MSRLFFVKSYHSFFPTAKTWGTEKYNQQTLYVELTKLVKQPTNKSLW